MCFCLLRGERQRPREAEDPGAWMIDGASSLREQEGIEARSQVWISLC